MNERHLHAASAARIEIETPSARDPVRRRGRGLAGWLFTLAALVPAAHAQEEEPGVDLTVEGDNISLAVNESTGIPMINFIKLTQNITGRVFTFQETDFAGNPNTNVNFVGTVRLKRDDFFGFFQTMLYIKGFAVVPRGRPDSEIVEIVNMQGPKRSEINASARYVPAEQITDYSTQTGVTILTSVPLEHINAQTATTQTRPFFSQAQAAQGGLIVGSLGNSALMLQGFGPQVYAAYQLLRLSDVPPEEPQIEYRVVGLEHATAEELQPVLKEVLDERNRRAVQAAGASGGQVTAGQPESLNVIAHGSLNKLLLAGTPERIVEALDLIARLDLPIESGGGDIHVILLKNVLAEDLRQTLREFIRADEQAERQTQQAQAGGSVGRQPRPTVIEAHKESNSLLISATQSKFKQLERMVEQLDRRQPQVLIEAALVELSTTAMDRFGVELGLLDIGAQDFTRPFGFTSFNLSNFEDTDDDGLPDTRLPDFDNPLQGVTGGIISSDDFAIPVLINAIQTDDSANILSLPSVVVNNNENALVKSEEDRPTQEVSQGTATTSTGIGESRQAGIELNISPSISSNDYLRLNIDLQVSRFLTDVDPTTGGPIITRQIRTAVTLPSGSTMILGGVIEDSESQAESGVPFLKDIPLLGYLFKTRSTDARKTNLYFFVTPTILDEDDFSDMIEVSQRKKLQASEYIGHRRLKIVDPKWTGGGRLTLEDSGATVDDLDRFGGFEIPHYQRPDSAPKLDGRMPTGPDLPDTGKQNGEQGR